MFTLRTEPRHPSIDKGDLRLRVLYALRQLLRLDGPGKALLLLPLDLFN